MLVDARKLDSLLGERTSKAFSKQLGIQSVADLLEHFPRRYTKRGELTDISQMPIGEMVTVVGEVVGASQRRLKGRSGSLLEVLITDGSRELTLAFFNQSWRQKDLHPGSRGLFSGKIGVYGGKLQLAHPDYELFDVEPSAAEAQAWADLPIPIYPSSGTLTTWKIQRSIELVLAATAEFSELFDPGFLEANSVITLNKAIRLIHMPANDADWMSAKESLRFHEALLLQLRLIQAANARAKQSAAVREPGELLGIFDKQLPFELTAGQFEIGHQIQSDLASGTPMHRLLQGEVGSGKTLVALRAMLTVAESGGQSALLAPTEVLANQHFQSIQNSLGPEISRQLGVRLLTGQQSSSERKKTLLDIASGRCLLVVGTHALISTKVQFYDLAFVVIDEQHRFGVEQREALRAKGKLAPHVLTMTATPIPRTLAITVFGDLEISTLTELPQGRQPISSHVVDVSQPGLVSRVWQRVAEEVASGRQAFVVCPRIQGEISEEGDEFDDGGIQPAAAEEIFVALAKNPALSGVKLGLLHGRQSQDEKSEQMLKFAANETQVLVSTTVIEVGVNVPNATAMVILDADRFGISQLHQLRGRVGRGHHPGICLMLTAAEPGSLASQRLSAVAGTNDGFKLSELDLELRKEGDVLGQTQAGGRSRLKLLRVIQDADIIFKARDLAGAIISEGLTPQLVAALETLDAQALEQS